MREIKAAEISAVVGELCVMANTELPEDIKRAIASSAEREERELGRYVLDTLLLNAETAARESRPICQDTGMAVVFCEVGQEVHITGGAFEDAVNAGVAAGYAAGCLRRSIVSDPLRRENTGDNTPAVIHTRIVPGDKVKITVAPKGFGSENMSAVRMFTPAADAHMIEEFVVSSVIEAGSNPCPPVIVGVGLGGDFESCALASKTALLRGVDRPNRDPFYAGIEKRILDGINARGCGPGGFGGGVTALAVLIEPRATHIAGLPCAVSIGCNVTRHASMEI